MTLYTHNAMSLEKSQLKLKIRNLSGNRGFESFLLLRFQ